MPDDPYMRIQATVLAASPGQALIQIAILADDEVVFLSEPQQVEEGDTIEVALDLTGV